MKLFAFISFLAFAVVSVLAQTIELGTPTSGTVLHRGKNFVAEVIEPVSLTSNIPTGADKSFVSGIHRGLYPSGHCTRDRQL
jgi:hypothetical protein